MNNLARPLVLLITLVLLATFAFQIARLVWHIASPSPRYAPSESRGDSTTTINWLQTTNFAPPAAASEDNDNAVMVQTSVSTNTAALTADWRLKGIYAEAADSLAIIEIDATSYVLGVSDTLDNGFRVKDISPETVTVTDGKGPPIRLQLNSKQLAQLVENTNGNAALSQQAPPAIAKTQPAQSSQSPRLPVQWLQHIQITPKTLKGIAGLQVSSNSTAGFDQLRQLGLRQGDILIAIDGQPLSPPMWRVAVSKWRQSQSLELKILRFGVEKIIPIKNVQ